MNTPETRLCAHHLTGMSYRDVDLVEDLIGKKTFTEVMILLSLIHISLRRGRMTPKPPAPSQTRHPKQRPSPPRPPPSTSTSCATCMPIPACAAPSMSSRRAPTRWRCARTPPTALAPARD